MWTPDWLMSGSEGRARLTELNLKLHTQQHEVCLDNRGMIARPLWSSFISAHSVKIQHLPCLQCVCACVYACRHACPSNNGHLSAACKKNERTKHHYHPDGVISPIQLPQEETKVPKNCVWGLEKRLSRQSLTARPAFSSQHPHGGLQPSVIPFPGGQTPSPASTGIRHAHSTHTYMQTNHSYNWSYRNKKQFSCMDLII